MRACLIGALGGLVFWHVTAMFFDLIDSPPTNVTLWALLGLILTIVYRSRAMAYDRTVLAGPGLR
jgi:hypothetical protein